MSTISRRAATITYTHKLAGFEPPINESVKAFMRGIRRKLGTAQKGKAPATAAVVAKLVKRLPEDLAGKRDKALILIGFATALGRSALIVKRWAKAARADSESFSGHSLRAGFVTSALADGADLFRVTDVAGAQRRKIQVQIQFSPVNSLSIRYNQRVSGERAARMGFWLWRAP